MKARVERERAKEDLHDEMTHEQKHGCNQKTLYSGGGEACNSMQNV